MYLLIWTILSVGSTLYIFTSKRYLKGTPELQRKYDGFYRTDVDQWNLLQFSVIMFFTAIPRMLILWATVLSYVLFVNLISIGSDGKAFEKRTTWRGYLCYLAAMTLAKVLFLTSGVWKVVNINKQVCYKKYLGPDWKPTFDGAGLSISNHQSWIDVLVIGQKHFSSYVAKADVDKVPIFSQGARSICCLFVNRGGTPEEKQKVLQQIKERQEISEKGLLPILHVYPEGCTTNGAVIIKFKKGAFAALRPIKPVVINYSNSGRLSCA